MTSYPRGVSLAVCRYHDPFNTTSTSSNCLRRRHCQYDHLTQHQFEQFLIQQNTKTLRELAFYFQSGDNYYCANVAFCKLIASEPNNAVNNFGYAQSFEGLNDTENAQQYYLNALKIAPNDNRCHSLYAHFLHSKLKNLHSAQQYYTTALKLDSGNPFTHCNYGKLLEEIKQFDDAEFHYKQCLSISPNHRKCLYFISRFYHKKKINYYSSKEYFDQLLDIGNNKEIKCWFNHFDYALLLKDMKYQDGALIHLDKALQYCTHNLDKADICYEMGLIYDGCNDIHNAQYYFNEASILDHKKYSLFYREFIEHHDHKLREKQLQTSTRTTQDNTSTTATAPLSDWGQFEQQISSTQCTERKTDDTTPTHVQQTTQYNEYIEHKEAIIDVIDDNVENITQEIKVKRRKNAPQMEFKRFLECNKLSMYYEKFKAKSYDDIRYLEIMIDDVSVLNDIGMSIMHLKYFKKQINKFLMNKKIMDTWLKALGDDHELYSEYCDLFERNGIFTFESFYRIARNKQGLLEIIGNENEFDAHFIWNNTPKQARKTEHQQEGV